MEISPKITRFINRGVLKANLYSPHILTAVGIVGVVTAGVMAAKATLRLDETLQQADKRRTSAESLVADGTLPQSTMAKVYARNAIDLVKLYGPSISLGAVSIVCIVSAHGIMHRRNVVLAAAYKGLEQAYKNYRERVIEQYGEEVDRDIRHGVRHETVTDAQGKKKKSTHVDHPQAGDYIVEFGPANVNWAETNLENNYFLEAHETFANVKLRQQGHLFLNEVLDALGMPRTPAGQIVGWVYKPVAEDNEFGDNYVDFNIQDRSDQLGYFLLEFNVDGIIQDKI